MAISAKVKSTKIRPVEQCEVIPVPKQVDMKAQEYLDYMWQQIYHAFAPKPSAGTSSSDKEAAND